MGRNIVEEYLISLGFKLDQSSMSQALDSVKNGADKITTFANKFTGNIGKVGVSTLGFIATATVSIAKFVDSVADADLEMQNQANSMWMNVDAYRNMDNAVKTLGYSMSDLNEIARNPELTNRFRELYNLSASTNAPKELDEQLKRVRDITTEVSKLKVLMRNGVRWVAYYLLQMSGGDANKLYESIRSKIDYLRQNLPQIAEKIAKVLYIMIQLGSRLFKIIGWIFDLFVKILKWFLNLPKEIKGVALTIAGILLVAFHPVVLMVGGILAALLLIDDYLGWKEGKNSLIDWSGFDSTLSNISGWWDGVTEWCQGFFDSVKSWWDGVVSFFEKQNEDDSRTPEQRKQDVPKAFAFTGSRFLNSMLGTFLPSYVVDAIGDKLNIADWATYGTHVGAQSSNTNITSKDTYNINVKTNTTSPEATARAISNKLKQQSKSSGILEALRSRAVVR